MLASVDEGHRNLFGIAGHQLSVSGDVPFDVRLSRFGADRRNDTAGVIAQMAARFREQQNSCLRISSTAAGFSGQSRARIVS